MDSQDDGDDLAPEGFGKDSGWITAAKRRVWKNAAARLCANSSAAHPDGQDALPSRNRYKDAKRKILRGSKMPPLPKDEMKIVVRPRGGLSITNPGPTVVAEAIWAATGISTTEREWDTMCPNPMQNVMVISTSSHEHAVCYTAVENITVAGQQQEVNAYVAAPHATCKGVIRRIAIEDGPEVIDRKIVNRRNPLALGAKRIKDTGTVVVLFEGYKVLKLRCIWGHSDQMDVCYTCGRLGHRSDVCPSPEEVACRGCGVTNSDEQHSCDPKCKLCVEAHLTAAKECKKRFQMPYVVRRRRGECAHNAEQEERSKPSPPFKDDQHFPAISEGRKYASIPEAALGLTAAPGPVPDPEGTRLERFLDRRERPPGLILSVDDRQR
ncbi:hypothetical protein HPB49_014498 [Dermacentor silvarum]|uniref:Uncharacterized protein n=1 Tax=Dermacentor silvarum TaxID=543639 RepID=A0ACB8DDG6_DERSI|nr:hypothetical protein HPB49_014498 [Dermacentor silvarum]